MRIDRLITDATALAELGRRLAKHRLERNWTQAELAREAGVGQATVQRAGRGDSVQMTSMIRLLRALELLDNLDAAIPESIELPIARLEREQRRSRRRASGTRGLDEAELDRRDRQKGHWRSVQSSDAGAGAMSLQEASWATRRVARRSRVASKSRVARETLLAVAYERRGGAPR